MGKFVNPKKIKGQDQLNRIKDLMGKMNTLTESKSFAELELIKKGPNGIVYGIIRENRNYFIKTTEKNTGTFLAEDFNYLGGVPNKYEERYKSYAEALKQLNLKFDMLNESFGIEGNNNIFESDGVPVSDASGGITSGGLGFVGEVSSTADSHWDKFYETEEEGGAVEVARGKEENPEDVDIVLGEDDEVEEQKKVIKVDAPAPPPVEAPVEDEVTDEFASAEVDEFGGEEEVDEFGGEEEGDDYTKKIQKLTGKVSQLVRDKDEPDAELDKYVINSIVSAIDWEEIPDEDVEDIIAKIEGEDEEDGEGEFGGEEEVDFEAEETVEEPTEELAEETQGSDKWEAGQKFKDSYLKGLSQKQLDKLATKIGRLQSEKDEKEAVKDDEDIEADAKKDAKDAEEKEKKDEEKDKDKKNESKTFSKKQLMETFLKKNANLALKKVLKENNRICEDCMGGGCPSCGGSTPSVSDDEEWAPLTEYSNIDMLAGDDINEVIDDTDGDVVGQDILYATGDLDRDGDQIPNRLDLDNNDDGSLDFGIGNKMYDWPERILGRKGDRDSDGIPNKYDSDVDGDGRDDDFIEIDIDSIMGNAPVKEPDVAPPTTTPGTKPRKPRWREITRPNVDPRPKGERKRPSSLRRGIYK